MNVVLRKWKKEDTEPLAILANNKKISDNLRDHFPHPYTFKDAEDWISLNEIRTPITNFAIQVNDQLAGGCGVLIKEDVYRHSAEIGYWLGEPFWGKGIATSAINLLIEKIIVINPAIVRIYAEVFEYNTASMKVLEKNGFQLESIREKAIIKNNIILNDHVWVRLLQ
jgi:RimJ/RimL family protein N-acetyltransferase